MTLVYVICARSSLARSRCFYGNFCEPRAPFCCRLCLGSLAGWRALTRANSHPRPRGPLASASAYLPTFVALSLLCIPASRSRGFRRGVRVCVFVCWRACSRSCLFSMHISLLSQARLFSIKYQYIF